ncbi:hypothetical protein VTG60DRAFT_2548 [Thermothelomyces hinnuleus]
MIRELHESKLGGYKGITKIIAQEVVQNYDICNRSKTVRHKPYRLLQPLPTADKLWSSVIIDFITKLPESKDTATGVIYDSILTIVDRLTKWVYFFLYKESWTAEQLADVIYRQVTSVHAWPQEWITDRDTKFVSKFWQALIQRLGVNSKLLIIYYPQTDGQTERLNQVVEQYLRSYINYQQDN